MVGEGVGVGVAVAVGPGRAAPSVAFGVGDTGCVLLFLCPKYQTMATPIAASRMINTTMNGFSLLLLIMHLNLSEICGDITQISKKTGKSSDFPLASIT